jgi:hypothetical protein
MHLGKHQKVTKPDRLWSFSRDGKCILSIEKGGVFDECQMFSALASLIVSEQRLWPNALQCVPILHLR